jgi:hypothetical protein
MSNQEPSGEASTNVRDSQGVVIGSGNNQYNAWLPKPPLDPAALSGLNPHTAVARLQQIPHDELVDFFARAKRQHVSEIIEVFAEADLGKIVASLGDINRRKAEELIGAVGLGQDHLLVRLPEAAEAIAREAASLKWTDAGPLTVSGAWYQRRYQGGYISWADDFGSLTVSRIMISAIPGSGSISPVSRERDVVSSSGMEGKVQYFDVESESVDYRTAVYQCAKHEPLLVAREAWGYYDKLGAEKSWLGFPLTAMQAYRTYETQGFEGGWILWRPGKRPIALRHAMADFVAQNRDLDKRLGFPLTEEQQVGEDGPSRIQFFENGVVTVRDGKYEAWLRPDSNNGQPAAPGDAASPPTESMRKRSRGAGRSQDIR